MDSRKRPSRQTVIFALRCSSTPHISGTETPCETCPYHKYYALSPDEIAYGFTEDDAWTCDVDEIALDAAAYLEEAERDAEKM